MIDKEFLFDAFAQDGFYVVAVGTRVFVEKVDSEYVVHVFPSAVSAMFYMNAIQATLNMKKTSLVVHFISVARLWSAYKQLERDGMESTFYVSTCDAKGVPAGRDHLFSAGPHFVH